MLITSSKTKQSIESALSRVAGFSVEITVRGMYEFTLSADGDRDFATAVRWLNATNRVASHETSYDPETDFSCCYISLTR
jgi:hypothetical protein